YSLIDVAIAPSSSLRTLAASYLLAALRAGFDAALGDLSLVALEALLVLDFLLADVLAFDPDDADDLDADADFDEPPVALRAGFLASFFVSASEIGRASCR